MEKELVRHLGELIGYGNMMQLASECWKESMIEKGYPISGVFIPALPCDVYGENDCTSDINWVACSKREPDTEDIYYVYPNKYQYTAQYHKYGKWAGKWTVDDQNGYEYEVHVDYWKVIEPPCL